MTAPATAPRQGFFRRHWVVTLVLVFVVLPAAVLAAWTAAALSFDYSERGTRVGYNQKFSHKGWVCKTWEGELAISNVAGQAPQLFAYTVREDSVVRQIQTLAGQRIAVTYEQHKGVPTSCFGETEYFVVAARPAPDAPFPGAAAAPR